MSSSSTILIAVYISSSTLALDALCAAIVTVSDNPAANLLLRNGLADVVELLAS